MNRVVIAIAVSAGLVTSTWLVTRDGTSAVEQVVRSQELLQQVDRDCLAEVMQVGENPSCLVGESYLGGDTMPTTGWICNGAFMPQRIQDCLTAAADRIAAGQ